MTTHSYYIFGSAGRFDVFGTKAEMRLIFTSGLYTWEMFLRGKSFWRLSVHCSSELIALRLKFFRPPHFRGRSGLSFKKNPDTRRLIRRISS